MQPYQFIRTKEQAEHLLGLLTAEIDIISSLRIDDNMASQWVKLVNSRTELYKHAVSLGLL